MNIVRGKVAGDALLLSTNKISFTAKGTYNLMFQVRQRQVKEFSKYTLRSRLCHGKENICDLIDSSD